MVRFFGCGGLAPLLAPGRGTYGSVWSAAFQRCKKRAKILKWRQMEFCPLIFTLLPLGREECGQRWRSSAGPAGRVPRCLSELIARASGVHAGTRVCHPFSRGSRLSRCRVERPHSHLCSVVAAPPNGRVFFLADTAPQVCAGGDNPIKNPSVEEGPSTTRRVALASRRCLLTRTRARSATSFPSRPS